MRPRIYVFGDSITEESFGDGGWGASLANHFARTLDVVLRGYSGYNTRWALKVIRKVFPPSLPPPMSVVVFFGANDACLSDRSSSFQHVPLDEYKTNLHSIVDYIMKQWLTTSIFLITPPPIDEDGRLRHPYDDNVSGLPERTNEAAGQYAKQCLAVAAECNARVYAIDLWQKMQQVPCWQKLYLRDGLHLTREGNEVVFEELIGRLSEAHISPMTLPTDLPLLEDIKPSDPLKSFDN